tara:strand:+ start:212 stop:466 length:255 start_codon:yes stop_codon:yes gene_type:complete
MSFRISFGLAEILGIFGSWALVDNNLLIGSILLSLSVFGVFMRMALDLQSKKESDKKIENVTNVVKDALFSVQTWNNKPDKNIH